MLLNPVDSTNAGSQDWVGGVLIYIAFSWVFALGVIFVEVKRNQGRERVDFLSAVSLAFLIVFVAAPNVLYLTPIESAAFLKFTWMEKLPSDFVLYLSIACVVTASYACICVGYLLPNRGTTSQRNEADLSRVYFIFGLSFLLFGLVAFAVFLEIVGGPVYAFQHTWMFRSGTPDSGGATNFAFVKRLSFFIIPGSVFLIQSASHSRDRIGARWALACVGVFAALVLLVFMQGRLLLASYILPILLSVWAMRRPWSSRKISLSICAVVAIFGTIYGVGTITKPMSAVVMEMGQVIKGARQYNPPSGLHFADKVSSIGMEFAFPFVNLTSTLRHVPKDQGYRWFSDIGLSFLQLIPKRLIPLRDQLPPRLYELNTLSQVGQVAWGIPVDLISFGWFSLGAIGVVITGLGFGRLVRLLEAAMPSGTYGDEIFRFSWMILVSALVMYGDPNWLVVEMFHWDIALFVFVFIAVRNRTLGVPRPAAG